VATADVRDLKPGQRILIARDKTATVTAPTSTTRNRHVVTVHTDAGDFTTTVPCTAFLR
jgi:hypothetical protein